MSKMYYVEVTDFELNNIEGEIRKRIVDMMTKEINAHAKELAISILQGKGLIKKKWYQRLSNKPTKEEVL